MDGCRKSPDNQCLHHLYLSAMRGTFEFEQGREDKLTPWRRQWEEYMRRLEAFDLHWVVREVIERPQRMWEEKDIQWAIIRFDMVQLRGVERTAEYPPPECSVEVCDDDQVDKEWRC